MDNKIEPYEDIRFPSCHKRDQIGLYVEAQSNISKRFYFTIGVREDNNEDFGKYDSIRLPSAYLMPTGDSELKIKTVVGTRFRAPSLFEIYSTENLQERRLPKEWTLACILLLANT